MMRGSGVWTVGASLWLFVFTAAFFTLVMIADNRGSFFLSFERPKKSPYKESVCAGVDYKFMREAEADKGLLARRQLHRTVILFVLLACVAATGAC